MCFTLNNPTESILFDEEKMQYLVYQEEIGESGTYHFQGYCEFINQQSLGPVKSLLGGDTVHIEPRRGSQEQAISYCKAQFNADGSEKRLVHTEPYEEGTPRQQGKRVDLIAFKDAVRDGAKLIDLVDDHTAIIAKYPKFYSTLKMLFRPSRDVAVTVTLLIGNTGTGKTRFVFDKFGKSDELWVNPVSNGTPWYDLYDGHDIVLLDDFAGNQSHVTLCALLNILDRYPRLVPTKGSHVWWTPTQIFVTTNILPKDWYSWTNREHQYSALARRFDKVYLYYMPMSSRDPGFVEQHRNNWWRENAPEGVVYIESDGVPSTLSDSENVEEEDSQ